MSDVMQRMEQKAVEKLTSEFADAIRSNVNYVVQDKLGYVGKECESQIADAIKGFCEKMQPRIRERALSCVQANFAELMELLSKALDKESED